MEFHRKHVLFCDAVYPAVISLVIVRDTTSMLIPLLILYAQVSPEGKTLKKSFLGVQTDKTKKIKLNHLREWRLTVTKYLRGVLRIGTVHCKNQYLSL